MAELTPETQRVWPPPLEQLWAGWWQPESLQVELEAWWLWCWAGWGGAWQRGGGWEVGMVAGPRAGWAQVGPSLGMAPSPHPWSPGH